MTKSPLAVALAALRTGERVIPAHSHRNAPKKYADPQLFALLVLRQFLGLDYRGLVQMVSEWPDLRQALGLKSVPHYSTLSHAERRFVKKGGSRNFSTRRSGRPGGGE